MSQAAHTYDFTHFSGYAIPNTTQIPDEFLDFHMAFLSGAEVKVMLYIFRRTLGFKRYADNISLNQLLTGIVKRDGTRLDHGTGLSKSTLLNSIKSLVEKKLIILEQRQSDVRGNEPTTYKLNLSGPLGIKNDLGVSENQTPLGIKNDLGVDRKLDQALVPKIEPTIYSNTTNSSTRNSSNNNTPHEQSPSTVVVDVLIAHGVGKGVAQSLAAEYPEDFIRQKVEYLEFLLAERPSDVKKPAAWLRRAIEQDFGVPDGFVSAQERQLQAEEEKRRIQAHREAQQRVFEHRQADEAQVQAALQERRLKVHSQYNPAPKDVRLWDELRADIQESHEHAVGALLAHTEVIGRSNGVLRVGAWHEITIRNLSQPRTQALIKRKLKTYAREPLNVEFTLLEDDG